MPDDGSTGGRFLALDRVVAGYGTTTILNGVSLALDAGECLCVLGRNGVGKTTLFRTIMGHARVTGGTMALAGRPLDGHPPFRRAALGLGHVPQERGIYASLSVEENLTLVARPGRWTLDTAYDFFPVLRERRRNMGKQLSGGEQQMLSIARTMMRNPSILLLDEPLEGLSPAVANGLLAAMTRLRREMTLTILLIEQHARVGLGFAERALVMDQGRVVHDGPSESLAADPAWLARLMGIDRNAGHRQTGGQPGRVA